MLNLHNRERKSLIYTPSRSIDSFGNGIFMDACYPRPLRECMRLPSKRDKSISTEVIILFFSGGPSTIAGFIISVIINSVKRMFGSWRITHISKEISKIMPVITYRNPSSAIIIKRWVNRVFTSLEHCSPNMINRKFAHTMCSLEVFPETTTRNYFPLQKVRLSDGFSYPTVTPTSKIFLPILILMGIGNYSEFSKSFIDHAYI